MKLRDQIGMWVKDRLSHDEHITITPKQALVNLEKHIGNLTAPERNRQLEHVKQYADVYYQGRHNMAVPQDFQKEFNTLSKRSERLNAVDIARTMVQKLGGPPTLETIHDSLSRSNLAREVQQAPVGSAQGAGAAKSQSKQQAQQQGAEMGMYT